MKHPCHSPDSQGVFQIKTAVKGVWRYKNRGLPVSPNQNLQHRWNPARSFRPAHQACIILVQKANTTQGSRTCRESWARTTSDGSPGPGHGRGSQHLSGLKTPEAVIGSKPGQLGRRLINFAATAVSARSKPDSPRRSMPSRSRTPGPIRIRQGAGVKSFKPTFHLWND